MGGSVDQWADLADEIEADLRRLATDERAEFAQGYLKVDVEHLGCTSGDVRSVARRHVRELRPLASADRLALVEALWREPVFERRLAAVEILAFEARHLLPEDAPLVERLADESGTWAILDLLATKAGAVLVDNHPEDMDAVVRGWATHDNFWVRRLSLLVHLPALRSGEGDFARFGALADPMLGEREFFIRKAIGWVLRDTSRKRPSMMLAWLEPRVGRASGLTIREACKHLPEDRARLLALAKSAK